MQRHKTGCGPCTRDRHCKCPRCAPKCPTGPTGPCCTGPTGFGVTGPTGPCCTGPTGFGVTGPTGPCCTGPTGAASATDLPLGARVFGPTQTIPSDPAGMALAFDDNRVRFDFGDFFDETTSATCLTVPADAAGVYQISGSVVWDDEVGAVGVRLLSIRVNGLIVAQDSRSPTPPAPGAIFGTAQTISTTFLLEAGDCVELVATQVSGAPVDILEITAYSPEFALVRVTPVPPV